MSNFFKRKTFESVRESGKSSNLQRNLNGFDLIMLGLGAIIGAGVFVLTGVVAAEHSGPAVMISYSIAGISSIFVALAYTELASMLPTSGSIYTYSYVAFGEVFAWVMGAALVLELTVSAAGVATSWAGYVVGLLKSGGIEIPAAYASVPSKGGIINIPAVVIVAIVTFILYLGTKDSKKLNTILVVIKMTAIAVFIGVAVPNFEIHNWDDFTPYGFDDVLIGASILFFAFKGFGPLATAAEECKNPKKDMMIGIIGSLLITTIIYVVVGGLATGITSFKNLNNSHPLAHALELNNCQFGATLVAIGAICGMTTVIMMNIYAQSRIFYAMSRDGLLPKQFSLVHKKYGSPYVAIFLVSAVVSVLAAFCPLDLVVKVASSGALIDYIAVMIVVMIFRKKEPDAVRSFKCPALFIVAPTGIIACLCMLFKQALEKDGSITLIGQILLGWLGFMLFIYIAKQITTVNSQSK